MASQCANRALSEFLSENSSFQLHTGDINTWTELKRCGAANSAEELADAIRLQLDRWKPVCGGGGTHCSKSPLKGNILCFNANDREASLEGLDRSDLKVTLKVFLGSATDGGEAIRQCVDSVLDELHTDVLEQLIVAFPDMAELLGDLPDSPSEEAELAAFVKVVTPTWKEVEALCVDEQRVLRVGVGDMEVDQLRALRDSSDKSPPVIDHYNIDACCEVPEELKAYARENNLLLLTHNDPRNFIASTSLQTMSKELGINTECTSAWQASWVGRYTVLINSRSVIIKKGYVVRFNKH